MSNISFYLCEGEANRILGNRLLKSITSILEELIEETEMLKYANSLMFHSECTPSITLENYLIRILRCAKCSEECFIIAFIYLERI